ncbi:MULTISPECIES: hypothetical protein [unclassified Inquilinus]|uniref:hypothetical protein n=1 Tax=unclassified Inquilinus TaxID=2645927 RepID=UPI003F91E830
MKRSTKIQNFSDAEKYKQLHEAIEAISSLDDSDQMYVNSEVSLKAREILEFLSANDAPAPTIFPNGEDFIVFKWKVSDIIYYLNIGEDGLEIVKRKRKADASSSVILPNIGEKHLLDLIVLLGGHEWRLNRPQTL